MKKFDTTKLEQLEQMIADRKADIKTANEKVVDAATNLASATDELEKALHGTDVDEGVRATVKEQMLKNQLEQRKRDLEKMETEPVMTAGEYTETARDLFAVCNKVNDELLQEIAKAVEKLAQASDESRALFTRVNRALFDAKKHLVCDDKLKNERFSENLITGRTKSYREYGWIQFIDEIKRRVNYRTERK